MANMNVNVTTANVPGNDLSATMKTFYDTSLLENSRQENKFNQFGMKQALPKNKGNKVEWRKFDTFAKAMTPLTEGVTPDGNRVNMTKIEAQIDQYGDYTTVSDRLELEAVDPIIMGVTEEHGAQAGETLDTLTRNVVIGGTHVMYAGGKTSRTELTAADKITALDVNKWNTHLKKMKAPKAADNSYICIIHPSVSEDLRESDGWLEAHKYAKPEEIFNGEIGMLHNIRFVESTNQKVYCGEDLASDARNLKVKSVSSNKVTFEGGTVETNALVDRFVLIGDEKFLVTENTATVMTLVDAITEQPATITASAGTDIFPGEGGKDGCAVYACLVIGKDAYGIIDPTAEAMEVIVKQRGSAGTADPLDQRSTVGWKASHAAKILYEERMLRFECGSSYSNSDEGN